MPNTLQDDESIPVSSGRALDGIPQHRMGFKAEDRAELIWSEFIHSDLMPGWAIDNVYNHERSAGTTFDWTGSDPELDGEHEGLVQDRIG